MSERTNTEAWTIRVNKCRNRDSRWGPGKVHWAVYLPKSSPANTNGFGYWLYACRINDETDNILGGSNGDIGNVPRDEPVTCKNCLKMTVLDLV